MKNKGFFVTPQPDWRIDAVISYVTRTGEIKEYPAVINTRNYMIDSELGIEFNCFVYENDVDAKRIKIVVQDHYEKSNKLESDWISVL